LRIGVQKQDGQFDAHAWLLYGEQVVIGATQLEKYELLTRWQTENR
jgi:hypothetical protein